MDCKFSPICFTMPSSSSSMLLLRFGTIRRTVKFSVEALRKENKRRLKKTHRHPIETAFIPLSFEAPLFLRDAGETLVPMESIKGFFFIPIKEKTLETQMLTSFMSQGTMEELKESIITEEALTCSTRSSLIAIKYSSQYVISIKAKGQYSEKRRKRPLQELVRAAID